MKKNIKIFYPTTKEQWRQWLQNNHEAQDSVWGVFYKKNAKMPTISWSEAVDEALCFGWIDSVRKSIDTEKYQQFFSKRKPKSTWSKINKEKVDLLIKHNLMTPTGLKAIKTAEQNGSWTLLDNVEKLIIPNDLETEFINNPNSKKYFLGLSKSNKKMILQWIVLAKRSETRIKRIREIVKLASEGQMPKQLR